MIKYEYKVVRTFEASRNSELLLLLDDGWEIKNAVGTATYVEYVLRKARIDEEAKKELLNTIATIGQLADMFGDDKESQTNDDGIKIRAVEDNEDDE